MRGIRVAAVALAGVIALGGCSQATDASPASGSSVSPSLTDPVEDGSGARPVDVARVRRYLDELVSTCATASP